MTNSAARQRISVVGGPAVEVSRTSFLSGILPTIETETADDFGVFSLSEAGKISYIFGF